MKKDIFVSPEFSARFIR